MFSKAERKISEEREKVLAVRCNRLYNGWDILDGAHSRYVTVDDVYYDVEPVIGYIIDDYDYAIGSVELSHHEYMGYNMIEHYRNNKGKSTLDFRFAELQDVIDLKLGEEIQSIIVKSSNLRYACFTGEQAIDFNIVVDSDLIETLNNLRIFIRKNKDIIRSINFTNVSSKATQLLLQLVCSEGKQDIVTFEELAEDKAKEYVRR